MNLLCREGFQFVVTVQVLLLVSTCLGSRTITRSQYSFSSPSQVNDSIQLHETGDSVVVNNVLIEVTFEKSGGEISCIKYGGLGNLLEPNNKPNARGYLDLVWAWPGQDDIYEKLYKTEFKIILQTSDLVELSFFRPWDKSSNVAPVNIDKRYIIRQNVAGVYTYVIYDRPQGWPAFDFSQTRLAYKLNEERFHYMVISDERQRIMPSAEDRRKGKPLAYPEAVLLTDPSDPHLKGEVDDKYQYSSENENSKVHGWIAQDSRIGFWTITPSYEFRACGPLKQELTSHVGPTTLSTFMTTHYAGRDAYTKFSEGEAWKKVFGPVMVYVNQYSSKGNPNLWEDAKKQMLKETNSWPYNFVNSKDFPQPNERGSVTGQLLVRDRYINRKDFCADSAYVGLALPGEVGSWQNESKGYQFWTRADRKGGFEIKNVNPGVYNLYSWVPGIVGDYKFNDEIIVKPGSHQDLGNLVYEPPRQGPTLWEIGVPDRKASEFYVPPVSPKFPNKLYTNLKKDWYRQYGLWDRYTDLYPQDDLVYTVGTSNYTQDWFFAHLTRNKGDNVPEPTTWKVNFELKEADPKANYMLRLALAEANTADIEIRFNDPKMGPTKLLTRMVGWDNAIARHGIHGLYHFYSFEVPGTSLRKGKNTMSLTQFRAENIFQGVMYDYIRLEGPPSTRHISSN